jgi:hypothetical protein
LVQLYTLLWKTSMQWSPITTSILSVIDKLQSFNSWMCVRVCLCVCVPLCVCVCVAYLSSGFCATVY